MMDLGPTLLTPRLILTPPKADEFEDFAALLGDPRVMEMLGGAQERAMAWRTFAQTAGVWALYGFGFFGVRARGTGAFVGRIGCHRPEGWPGTEVGWGLTFDAQGKGYATEAASACMDFAVDGLGWTEVVHCIDSANTASQAVARRLGSRVLRTADLPAPSAKTVDVWGQTAEEWRARRASLCDRLYVT
jgi:RimJ/RimL family protein N-acetyltransferase